MIDWRVLVSRQVPGFAGAWLEEETLHISLTEPGVRNVELAREQLRTLFGYKHSPDRTVVHRASFSFGQLHAWHEHSSDVLTLPGVVSTGIREQHNRLAVGVQNKSVHADAVRDFMRSRAIPVDALMIQESGPFNAFTPLPEQTPSRFWLVLAGLALGLGGFVAFAVSRVRRFPSRDGGRRPW